MIINSKNEKIVKAGMVFNVILSLRDLKAKNGRQFAIMLSDTVRVLNQGAEVLTNDIKKTLGEISYGIEV